MWLSRKKSSNGNNNKNNCNRQIRRTPSNRNFNPQSFKNIQNLFADNDSDNFTDSNIVQEQRSSSSTTPSSATATATKRLSVFHRVHLANQFVRAFETPEKSSSELNNAEPPAKLEKSEPVITIPGAEKRVVVYTTSLGVVRATFNACRTVLMILQGFRVPIEERDLSMDSAFLDELQKIMAQGGQEGGETKLTLPRVFIGGRYVGGAEEVKQLHEIGELKKIVQGLPAADPGVCQVCGDFSFILCNECSGSRKCYTEKGGFRTCTACNENGLIRCPSCLSR